MRAQQDLCKMFHRIYGRMGQSLCKKNYLLEKDDEAIQLQNKIPDDANPKHSFSKNDDTRMLSY